MRESQDQRHFKDLTHTPGLSIGMRWQGADAEGLRAAQQKLSENPALLEAENALHEQFRTYGCQGSSKQLKSMFLPVGNPQGVTTTFNTLMVNDATPQLLVVLRPRAEVIREVTTELIELWEKKKEEGLNETEKKRLKECQAMCLFAMHGKESSKKPPFKHDWAHEVTRLKDVSDFKDFHDDFQVGR